MSSRGSVLSIAKKIVQLVTMIVFKDFISPMVILLVPSFERVLEWKSCPLLVECLSMSKNSALVTPKLKLQENSMVRALPSLSCFLQMIDSQKMEMPKSSFFLRNANKSENHRAKMFVLVEGVHKACWSGKRPGAAAAIKPDSQHMLGPP